MNHASSRNAFTLVEMAIVLAIIGIITGGVLVGKNMLRASAVRSVAVDFTTYNNAIAQFIEQYRAVPGDMNNATQYWGARDADPATCRTLASTNELTCDGNGDGTLNSFDGYVTYSEIFRAWQHLANAGLIGGRYNGVGTGSTYNTANIGVNVPESRIKRAGFSLLHIGTRSADPHYFDGNWGNMMFFGLENTVTRAPALTPKEAEGIDVKLDDGKPALGSIVTWKGSSTVAPGCAAGDTTSTEYNLTRQSVACSLMMDIAVGN